MEFFNKKQDVLDIELTSYGKQLLSRGLFHPMYYAFSDDGILYDQKWVTGSASTERQSEIEPRIQEGTPRLKTQNRKVGAERAIHILPAVQFLPQLQLLADLFEYSSLEEALLNTTKMNIQTDFIESQKLLENVLGTKSYFNDYNPAWNLLLYHGNIKNSTSYYQKKDIVSDIPQVNITLSDTLYKLRLEDDPQKIVPEAKNIMSTFKTIKENQINFISEQTQESVEGLYFETFTVDDGKAFVVKDFVFLSLEEQNVNFTKDNFMVEVYEVTTVSNDNDEEEEKLEKLIFGDDPYSSISRIFQIDVDDETSPSIACNLINHDKTLKEQNIYTSNVFDCTEIPSGPGVNVDPYTNLPDVDVGDTC